MSKEAQGVELPNNLIPDNYPQKFVQSKEFPPTAKSQGKDAPTEAEVMRGFAQYPA